MNAVGMLLTCLLLPESPIWLHHTKQYKKCMEAVACLAEINNKRDFRPIGKFYKYLQPGTKKVKEDHEDTDSLEEPDDNDSTSEVVEDDEELIDMDHQPIDHSFKSLV